MSILASVARIERFKPCHLGCSLMKKLLKFSERRGNCSVYLLSPKSGYPKISDFNVRKAVHIHAYEHVYGPVPRGLNVLHKCDVKHCWEPDCLYAGTHWENMIDVVDRNRRRYKTGLDNYNGRLSREQVSNAIERVANGEMQASVAKDLGVSRNRISKITKESLI